MSKEMSEIIIMPPYVEKEHRPILEDAQNALDEYSAALMESIQRELFSRGKNTNPEPSEIKKAEVAFMDDPVRKSMVRNLNELKLIYERPRFLLKAKENIR